MYTRLWLTAAILVLLATILNKSAESNNIFLGPEPARILLLTAHPDDECLFFGPTILSLISHRQKGARIPSHPRDPDLEVDVNRSSNASLEIYSLCLSIGDANGLGGIRRQELERSFDVLGLDGNKRFAIDHPDLQDNMTLYWSPHSIADVLFSYINEHRITTVLTFDRGGISGHPNHKSLSEGVKHLLTTYDWPSAALPPPKLYTLITLPVAAKYTSILAPSKAKLDLHRTKLRHRLEKHLLRMARGLGVGSIPSPLEDVPSTESSRQVTPVFVSGMPEYFTALRAMREHKSQLVWFRWLYVLFSRYMWVNEWAEIQVEGST